MNYKTNQKCTKYTQGTDGIATGRGRERERGGRMEQVEVEVVLIWMIILKYVQPKAHVESRP